MSGRSVRVALNVRDKVFDLFENTFLVVGLFVESTVVELSCELEYKSVIIELFSFWTLVMILITGK